VPDFSLHEYTKLHFFSSGWFGDSHSLGIPKTFHYSAAATRAGQRRKLGGVVAVLILFGD